MYRVLIIDDEPIIRKGLKNIINWKQFDCEVCGEAADGIEGRELLKNMKPDILITDIRMPEVDGLTMVREVKELIPGCKIIILTGYRDFEYVQEAIKIGAFDYILKPSKIEELTEVIGRAVKELKFQKDRSEEINKLKVLFEQNIPILREKFLYDIIYGINTNEQEIMAKMELFGVKIEEYVLVVMENDTEEEGEKTQYDKHLYQFGIINTFEEIFNETSRIISISINDRRVAFVVQQINTDRNEKLNVINERCMHLQEIIKNCFGFTVTIAISSSGDSAMELPSKLKECQEALEYKLYMGSNSIIQYNDLNSFFKCEDYSALEKYQWALIESIKAGNEKVVRSNLLSIFNYIDSLGNVNNEYFRNFYWSVISSINSIRVSVSSAEDENDIEKKKDIASLYTLIKKCKNLKELNDVLEEVALKVAARVNSYNNKSLKLILRKAIDYINAHYNEQVTLNEVAENIYVSTFYISRMFKKDLGKSFVDYLNEIRIEKAKELLRDIKYKTYEVAETVGIPDAHYFSKLFKKHTGVTPTEYRDSQS